MELVDFFNFIFRIGFSNAKWKRELNQMRIEVKDLNEKLIPFNYEELELLSLNQSNVSIKRGFSKIYKGILETIYFEPLFSYIIKDFKGDYRLLLVNSSKHELALLKKSDATHVFLNNKLFGYFTKDFVFLNENRKPVAYIDFKNSTEQCKVWLNGKNIGFVRNPTIKKSTTIRAFSLFSALKDDDLIVFMSLILAYILESLPKK